MKMLLKKKEIITLVNLVMIGVLASLLLISASPIAVAQSPQEVERELVEEQIQKDKKARIVPLAPPAPIPGEIFTGDYLRIGINPGGTLGVGARDPGVGFQWAGDRGGFPSTESAAIWWWGEGYKIAYKEKVDGVWVDKVAYYQPGYGWPPPPATNIVPVSETLIRDDDNAAVKKVKVKTPDGRLIIIFTFTLLKKYPELNIETTIRNRRRGSIRDVIYTRIVDWDVCTNTTGNKWTSTDHAAYAWYECGDPLPSTQVVQLTAAGHDRHGPKKFWRPIPVVNVNYVDLYAWHDMTTRKPKTVVQSFAPITGDYNVGIYYKIGEMKSFSTRTVYTVYQANFPPVREY